jgi:hypothetical protein
MSARRLLPAALAALLLGGCALLPDDDGVSAVNLSAVRDARDRWEASGADDYTFDIQVHLGLVLARPARVTVLDGEVVSIQDRETGQPVANPGIYAGFDTVEELLSQAEDAILDAPASFTGRYDELLGYPRLVAVDPRRNAVDEEWGYQVEGFHLLLTAQ